MSADNSKMIMASGLAVLLAGFVFARVYKAAAPAASQQATLFERIGGDAAVAAAVDLFYNKVLADPLLVDMFAHTDMMVQRRKQVAFLSVAFGKPNARYNGLAMDTAHRRLVSEGKLNDTHFDAVAGHLASTLLELGLKEDLVMGEVIPLVGSLRNKVLCRE